MTDDTIYKIYVKWMATPTQSRKPKTQEEFLSRYELTQADIFEYQERKTYPDDLSKETMNWAKKKTPAMLHVLYEKYLETKNPQDLKIWQDAIKYSEENQKQTSLEDLIDEYELSENQLVAIAYRILDTYDPKGLLKPSKRHLEALESTPGGVSDNSIPPTEETIPEMNFNQPQTV